MCLIWDSAYLYRQSWVKTLLGNFTNIFISWWNYLTLHFFILHKCKSSKFNKTMTSPTETIIFWPANCVHSTGWQVEIYNKLDKTKQLLMFLKLSLNQSYFVCLHCSWCCIWHNSNKQQQQQQLQQQQQQLQQPKQQQQQLCRTCWSCS